jgi:hypothetical protein
MKILLEHALSLHALYCKLDTHFCSWNPVEGATDYMVALMPSPSSASERHQSTSLAFPNVGRGIKPKNDYVSGFGMICETVFGL